MMMFADMVGGLGRPNADLSENRIKGKTYLFSNAKKIVGWICKKSDVIPQCRKTPPSKILCIVGQ